MQRVRKWSEAYQKAAAALMETSQAFTSVPALIDKYTEYVKATSKLYRSVMTLPTVTGEEVEQVTKKIEKTRTVSEKRASKATPGTSQQA